MTETLLSPSNVLLFGRVVADLKIVAPKNIVPAKKKTATVAVASTQAISPLAGTPMVDGQATNATDLVLVKDQDDKAENGIYKVVAAAAWTRDTITTNSDLADNWLVTVTNGTVNAGTGWLYFGLKGLDIGVDEIEFLLNAASDPTHNPFVRPRMSSNEMLQDQVAGKGSRFARIYGFSFEGTYFELGRPALFLVHGAGVDATEVKINQVGKTRPARAPGTPSLTGLVAADFQWADDLKVWSYDKSDYTIRLDMESGMFEDILLAPFFGDTLGLSGAKISGAKVSGAKLSGGRISGAKISGAKLSGGASD